MDTHVCPHCHYVVSVATAVCPNCGHKLISSSEKAARFRMTTMQIFGLFLVVMGGILFVIKSGNTLDGIIMMGAGLVFTATDAVLRLFHKG